MLFKHLLDRLISYKEYNKYNLSFLIIGVFVVFMMLSFRDLSVNKIDSTLFFNEHTVLVPTDISSNHYPNGFVFSPSDCEKIHNNFDSFTLSKSTQISSAMKQNITFTALTPDFVKTGVLAFDYSNSIGIVQKIEILYGQSWSSDITEPVVVIDQTTAMNLFGYYDTVGNVLRTSFGDLTIIGVVTDTLTREQLIQKNRENGQVIDQYIYHTQAYIPLAYYESMIGEKVVPDHYIIHQNSLKDTVLKSDLLDMFNIKDSTLLTIRDDIIQREILDNESYFKILTSITAVLVVLGIANFINISTFFFSIYRRNNAIYRVVGSTKGKIVYYNFLESVFMSTLGCLASLILGLLVLVITSIFTGNLKYVRLTHLLEYSAIILGTVVAGFCIINVLISVIFIKKKFYEELKDTRI